MSPKHHGPAEWTLGEQTFVNLREGFGCHTSVCLSTVCPPSVERAFLWTMALYHWV